MDQKKTVTYLSKEKLRLDSAWEPREQEESTSQILFHIISIS